MKKALKKTIAAVVAIIQIHTQVVFAGLPFFPQPTQTPSFLPSLLQIIKKNAKPVGLVVFHAFPFSNLIDPRGQTDIPQETQTPPDRILDREERQMSILRQLEDLKVFKQKTFEGRPELPGRKADILDTLTTYDLNTNVGEELKRVWETRKQSTESMEASVQSLRRAIAGAGGSMRYGQDGSRMFFLHGFMVAHFGQRFVDGNGQVTTVDTRSIKYDKKSRLQTGFTRISRDSRGNITTTVRTGIRYSDDSHQHGKQLVTAYKDTIMDPNGNISLVERNNIEYFQGHGMKKRQRGMYEASYDEVEVDQFGNETTRRWENGDYIQLEDNFYLTRYDLTETDADHNTTNILWRGGNYQKNHNYQDLKSINTSRQEYLLSEFTQIITDPRGLTRTEIQRGIEYNNQDNLIAFDQTNLNANHALPTEIRFRNGEYDEYGQQTAFERTETTSDGSEVKVTRLDTAYNRIGDITSYSETTEGDDDYKVRIDRYGIEYNNKRQQMAYKENQLDQSGRSIETEWSARTEGFSDDAVATLGQKGYDERGRLIGFEETTKAEGLTVAKLTTDITFDQNGQQAGSKEMIHTTGQVGTAGISVASHENVLDVTRFLITERVDEDYNEDTGQLSYYEDRITDYTIDNTAENPEDMLLRDLLIEVTRSNITLDGFEEERHT
ncbi:hypothetical protein BVX98_07560, partial [bacterium F11]